MSASFVSRILVVAGVFTLSLGTLHAQGQSRVGSTAKIFSIVKGREKFQPVAPSTVILDTKGNLTTSGRALSLTQDQVGRISEMNKKVAALNDERARLWVEYRALVARPDFSDAIASTQAAPRMKRIIEINSQLAPLATAQETQLRSVLNSDQRTRVGQMVSALKSSL